ncbi:hypothetical protein HHK36_024110 [Tetracentron sinense]|uniref:PsbQ-like protein 3, chloroplastic n=1 Tax=Tetracentron sinense TaxID=13715 RepID=A0A835D3Y9_TETSI|nr:hypothetical protein HHK36_024110 [Tetracentron sinense]
MSLTPVALHSYHQSFTCYLKSSIKFSNIPQKLSKSSISRRVATTAILVTVLLGREAIFNPNAAYSFDFRMTVPDQTVEEAESGIRGHAQDLLQIKAFIDAETWREAQKALRKSSSSLKQDIYTIIQAKPGSERPQLRKLYSILFNSVTKLDYAARSKDATQVRECYEDIVVALDDILSRI